MSGAGPVRIGVVADTPRTLPEALLRGLDGVDRILHAGGIHALAVLDRLRELAPVDAVPDEDDFVAFGDALDDALDLEIAGARLLLTSLVGAPTDPLGPIRVRLEHDPPDAIVFGHPPLPAVTWVGGTLFFCPGSVRGAGPGRARSFGLLAIEGPGRVSGVIRDL
ncbi:MAG: metallophosphoesterase [Acidobacteriota bacterium]